MTLHELTRRRAERLAPALANYLAPADVAIMRHVLAECDAGNQPAQLALRKLERYHNQEAAGETLPS